MTRVLNTAHVFLSNKQNLSERGTSSVATAADQNPQERNQTHGDPRARECIHGNQITGDFYGTSLKAKYLGKLQEFT